MGIEFVRFFWIRQSPETVRERGCRDERHGERREDERRQDVGTKAGRSRTVFVVCHVVQSLHHDCTVQCVCVSNGDSKKAKGHFLCRRREWKRVNEENKGERCEVKEVTAGERL